MRRYTTTIKQMGRVIKVYGPKKKRKIKIDPNNQFHKIKNISARKQLLMELAAAEKGNKK